MKIPKVEYELYYPLNGSNLYKLNLTLCKNMKIDILIPVSLTDDIDKHNSSSDYYNNICSKATSKSNTDILLGDRRNEFIKNNMSLCEGNCELTNYDYKNKKAKCSCNVKTKLSLNDVEFDKTNFFKSDREKCFYI